MKTNNHSEIGWHMILGAIVFLMLVPIVFALSNSFKTLQDAFNTIFEIIPSHPTLENYRHVFEKLPFVQITLNTFLIAASVTTFKTITSLFAAYSFVYFEYKGKQFFYFIMLSTMFIPFTVTMIPNYLMISKLGLRDCIWGVALPQFADVLGIFLLRQAMRGIPKLCWRSIPPSVSSCSSASSPACPKRSCVPTSCGGRRQRMTITQSTKNRKEGAP